jgi:AraC-like DNA-binding protein
MLKRFRMNHAVKLLSASSSPSVAEVADNCGFENTDYFIKAFKAHYKTTPACFRQRNTK